jgi:hypoxanthine-DNA glycosylase
VNRVYNYRIAEFRPTPMTSVYCFAPIENKDARILILGSMPGRESLKAEQYYAHQRNAFWPVMGELVGASPSIPYESRVQILTSAGIALWDVLASCRRLGSMDSDIEEGSIQPNDFESFYRSHPKITRIIFNGAMAEKCYRKQVLPLLKSLPLLYLRVPSTSPANVSIPYEQKLNAWRAALEGSPSASIPSEPAFFKK